METKRAVGRPTLYNDEMQERADNYLFVFDKPVKDGGCGEIIPTTAGLACYLGVSKSSVLEWARVHPEFSRTLENVATRQEQSAVNGGLCGVFNSTITKLLLANHGYSDKQDIAHTSPDGSLGPTRIVIEAAVDNRDDSATT